MTKRPRGFTLVELMVTVTVLGIMMAIGLPSLMSWLSASRTNAMPEFYLDGLRKARDGAIKHNAAARLVLSTNANGQFDWQIDWCAPVTGTPCNDTSGAWSTTASAVSTVSGQPPGPSNDLHAVIW
jgi:type IV fimbrial biogenesis protein FimT